MLLPINPFCSSLFMLPCSMTAACAMVAKTSVEMTNNWVCPNYQECGPHWVCLHHTWTKPTISQPSVDNWRQLKWVRPANIREQRRIRILTRAQFNCSWSSLSLSFCVCVCVFLFIVLLHNRIWHLWKDHWQQHKIRHTYAHMHKHTHTLVHPNHPNQPSNPQLNP